MSDVEVTEADSVRAHWYFRNIGCIDNCRVGKSHIDDLAEVLAAHRIAAEKTGAKAERSELATILRKRANGLRSIQNDKSRQDYIKQDAFTATIAFIDALADELSQEPT